MIRINLDAYTLATMTSEEFETLAFRLTLLQASSVPVPSVPASSVKRANSGANEHGPNVLAYLANKWPDGKGDTFTVERFRLGEIARAQFAALETPLLDNESIALACLQAGKTIGDYFTKGKAESVPVVENVVSVLIEELDEDDI